MNTKRSAFTLLELILALALSMFVMAAISMAIHLHLRLLDTRRSMVEKSQVARVVLNMMAEDIRSAVQQKPVDVSSLEGMVSLDLLTGELVADAGVDPAMLDEMLGSGEDEGAEEDLGLEDEASISSSITTSVEPPPVPGLYGDASSLQVDVSKLPRIDQYNPSNYGDDPATSNVPVDIKTVAYFAGSGEFEDDLASVDAETLKDQGALGLYRREMPRATTAYAIENGYTFEDESLGELLAPEVASVTFRYFDGIDWVEEWDSEEMASLPLAVEIVLLVADAEEIADLSNSSLTDVNALSDGQFRLVVFLPMAELADEEATDEEMLDEETGEPIDSGSSSSANSGAGSDAGDGGRG